MGELWGKAVSPITWVDLVQTVKGLNRTKRPGSRAKRNSPADYLGTGTVPVPVRAASALLGLQSVRFWTADFGLPSF